MAKGAEWEVIELEVPALRVVTGGLLPEEKASVVLRCPEGHLLVVHSNPGLFRGKSDFPCNTCPLDNGYPRQWPTPGSWRE